MSRSAAKTASREGSSIDLKTIKHALDGMGEQLGALVETLSPEQRKRLAKPRVDHGGIYQVVADQAPKYGVQPVGATVADMVAAQQLAEAFGGVVAAAELVVKIATDGKMANAATAWTIAGTCYKTLRDLSRRSPELRTALEPVRQAMKVGKVGSKGRKGAAAAAARSAGELREGSAGEALVLRAAPSNGATNGIASPATH